MSEFTPTRGGPNPTTGKISKPGAFSEDPQSSPEIQPLAAGDCEFGRPASECEGAGRGCSGDCEDVTEASAEMLSMACDYTGTTGILYRKDFTAWLDEADEAGGEAGRAVRERMRRAMETVEDVWGTVHYAAAVTEFERPATPGPQDPALTEREALAATIAGHQRVSGTVHCSCGTLLGVRTSQHHALHLADQIQAALAALPQARTQAAEATELLRHIEAHYRRDDSSWSYVCSCGHSFGQLEGSKVPDGIQVVQWRLAEHRAERLAALA